MKNIALIIAGGVGARMGQDIPKQFINVHDKPVKFIHWKLSKSILRLMQSR